MEQGPEAYEHLPLSGVDFAYGNTSFEIMNFNRLVNIRGGQPETLLDIKLIEHPVASINIAARQTDDLNMFLPTYRARIGLNSEIVDTAWIDECFQTYLGNPEKLSSATEDTFVLEETESKRVLNFTSLVSGSRFNLGLQMGIEGPSIVITNGDMILASPQNDLFKGVPMLRREVSDEVFLEDFLEVFSYVMHQTPFFAYERHFSESYKNSAPNYYLLQGGSDDYPAISRDGVPIRHYPVMGSRIFQNLMRELFGQAEIMDYPKIDDIQDRLAKAKDFQEAETLNAQRNELVVVESKTLDRFPGLRPSVRGALNSLASLYIDPGFSNMQIERGVVLQGIDEVHLYDIAEVFAATIGADFKMLEIEDFFNNCSFRSSNGIVNFLQTSQIIPKNTIRQLKKQDLENPEQRMVLYIRGLEEAFSAGRQDRQRARHLASALAESMSKSPGLFIFAGVEEIGEVPLSLVENDVFGNVIKVKKPGKEQRRELLVSLLASAMSEDAVAEKNRVYDLANIDIDYLTRRTKGLTASEIQEAISAAEITKYRARNRGEATTPITPADIVRAIGEIDE